MVKNIVRLLSLLVILIPFNHSYSLENVHQGDLYIGGSPKLIINSSYTWGEKGSSVKSKNLTEQARGYSVVWGSFISEKVRSELEWLSTSARSEELTSISNKAFMFNVNYDIFSFLLLNVYCGVGGGVTYTDVSEPAKPIQGRYNVAVQAKGGISLNLPFNFILDASYSYLTTPEHLQPIRFMTPSFPLNHTLNGPVLSLYKVF